MSAAHNPVQLVKKNKNGFRFHDGKVTKVVVGMTFEYTWFILTFSRNVSR